MGESKEAKERRREGRKEGGKEERRGGEYVTCTRQFSCPSSRARIYLCYIIMEVVLWLLRSTGRPYNVFGPSFDVGFNSNSSALLPRYDAVMIVHVRLNSNHLCSSSSSSQQSQALGPLHTRAKSRDHVIVRAQKKCVPRASQHTSKIV